MTIGDIAIFVLFYPIGVIVGYIVVRYSLYRITDWNTERKRRKAWPEWEQRIREAKSKQR